MRIRILLLFVLLSLPVAAGAEVALAAADGLHSRHQFRIEAPAARVWESLIHPERWWPSDHTWSGQRESLSLSAEAGGCYCEKWSGGSAQHGRVIMAVPQKVLRLNAALGPFLEMAISGVLSITLAEKDSVTVADVSYRVSGDAAHKLDSLAPIVDQVLGFQFGAFAEHAGRP
jgi:uncharacterized protein YndB with AHSA1/START domain